LRDADGRERWLMSRGQPLRDSAGAVTRYLGIALDITERKRAEEALAEATRTAEHNTKNNADQADVILRGRER
jgi:hypothetical protein